MASLYTGYQGWLAGIRDYIGADNYSDAQVQQFLFLAQLRLNRELMSVFMEERISVPITTAGPYFPGSSWKLSDIVPDFNKIHNVALNGYGAIAAIPSNEMSDWFTAISNGFDDGTYKYRIWAQTLGIQPALVDGQTLGIQYYVEVPYLSASLDSNVFTEHHSDALLYATCLEASSYMVEDERIPVWQSGYNAVIESWNENPKKVRMGSTPLVRKIKFG